MTFSHFNKIFPVLWYQSLNMEISLVIKKCQLIFSMSCLKTHLTFQYSLLSCITGVDFLNKKYRFSIVYDLVSLQYNARIRVKTFLNQNNNIDSIINIYINSNWWEREIWDMYGIYFNKHFNLRRMLTDYGFEGHPLRKDFPLSGFVEVRYSFTKKHVNLELTELSQELRFFNFQNVYS